MINKYDKQLRAALFDLWAALKNRTSERQLTALLNAGDLAGVLATLSDLEPQLAAAMSPVIESAILESGRIVAPLLPAGATTAPLAVSLANSATAAFIQTYMGEHIVEISRETRQAVQDAVLFGANTGMPPAAVARDFKQSIGLNSKAQQAVRNFRTALESDPASGLSRQLRDKRFDPTLARNEPLTQKQIDKMVERYAVGQLRYRTESIARTESMTAVSVGQEEAIRQGLLSGAIRREREDGRTLRKGWIVTKDGRQREDHDVIPGMNVGGVPIDEPFNSPLGPIQFPREPGQPAKQVIRCRCRVKYFWG